MPKISKELIKKIAIGVLTSVVIAFLYSYRYQIYYTVLRILTPKSSNPENNEIIRGLHPIFAYKAGKIVKDIERNGGTIVLTSGYRSPQKQEYLYNTGQTTAPALSSYHNFGFAFDCNINGLKMASSKDKWKPFADYIKDKYNVRWGGDFSSFYDPVHFDYGTKYPISELRNLYNEEKLVNKTFVKTF